MAGILHLSNIDFAQDLELQQLILVNEAEVDTVQLDKNKEIYIQCQRLTWWEWKNFQPVLFFRESITFSTSSTI